MMSPALDPLDGKHRYEPDQVLLAFTFGHGGRGLILRDPRGLICMVNAEDGGLPGLVTPIWPAEASQALADWEEVQPWRQ